MSWKPKYNLTPIILKLVQEISQQIGELKAYQLTAPPTHLRRSNRIKSIHASLSIEGNTLSIGQVTAIIDKQRVIGPKVDILEVQNAIKAYEEIHTYVPYKKVDLLKAHNTLMTRLLDRPGRYRTTQVGITKGSKNAHLAPPPSMVPSLMQDLLAYCKDNEELTLIKSCVFHYELEFIHPFIDGNGRIGRLWQTLILIQEYPVFAYIPIEQIILHEQQSYYKALAESDKGGHSTAFIEFMLHCISESLKDLLSIRALTSTFLSRLEKAQITFADNTFTRKQYMQLHKTISTATASRDLARAVKEELIIKMGEKRMARYEFKFASETKIHSDNT